MYINDHPEIIVIDPMESVQKLFDRITSYQIMKECEILEEGWLYNKANQCNKSYNIIIFYERRLPNHSGHQNLLCIVSDFK